MFQAGGDKWTYMKDGDRKRMEKKKDYRNVEDAKKVIAEKFQRKMPEKIKTKEGKSGEIFLKDEVRT